MGCRRGDRDELTMRILVVEDAERMAQLLKKGLTEECYAVDIAGDGPEGLRQAQSGEYDLVLLDVNLPGLDGFGVIRALRQARSDVPVIMVTARDGSRGLGCTGPRSLCGPWH